MRRGLALGKQKCWIVVSSVCSRLELAEAVWPVTNAGRSRARGSLALCEQGGRTAPSAEVPLSVTPRNK